LGQINCDADENSYHPFMTTLAATNSTDAPPSKRLPGDLAIWIFILAEMLAFAVFFSAYAFARAKNVEMFNLYQQTLDRNAGALNTLLLITGSWFVVLAVQAAHRDDNKAVTRNVALGFLCGGAFLVVKVFEYSAKFGAGISLSTNTFYMFYISLTFFHFMHVILGMVILTAIWLQARKGAYTSQNAHGLESGAAYWHMVDLLWIILFPLVYVMR
jgi:nitric oxide reductase NorE protein